VRGDYDLARGPSWIWQATVARKLEREHHALRLSPDEWMIPLFGEPEADGKRDVLEGRMNTLALSFSD
jgi:predicted kinase